MPKRIRVTKISVLFLSLTFYTYLAEQLVLILLISSLIDFFVIKKLQRTGKQTYLLFLSLAGNLIPLLYYKSLWLQFEGSLKDFTLLVPLGISFYTFKSLKTVFEYKKHAKIKYLDFLLYLSFFPTVLAGPINSYEGFSKQLNQLAKFSFKNIEHGLLRISLGLFKKVFLLTIFFPWWDELLSYSQISIIDLTTIIFSSSLYLFIDFSAYCDIAIGGAKVFSIDIPENFKASLLATDFRKYWDRQHITMTNWFKQFIFFPSLKIIKIGNSKTRVSLAMILVYIVSSLWHGLYPGAIVFGCSFLLGEFVRSKISSQARISGWIVTQFFSSLAIFFLIVPLKTITNFKLHFGFDIHYESTLPLISFYLTYIFLQNLTIRYQFINQVQKSRWIYPLVTGGSLFLSLLFWSESESFLYHSF